MCMYCEKKKDVKFGWNQPSLCDKNWEHPINSIPNKISSNLNGEPFLFNN